jgi:adenylate cyclase
VTVPGPLTSKQLYRYLISLYTQGSLAAVVIVFFLVFIGLDFNGKQWAVLFACLPVGMAFYVVPDIFLIIRHYRPLGTVLEQLDEGKTPSEPEVSQAVVGALNLPYLTFQRVVFFHGPAAACMSVLVLLFGNVFAHANYMPWQIFTFFTIILFFASPSHAICEFFSVWRCMVPVIERLYPLVDGALHPRYQAQIKQTGLKKKLLYLAIGVTSLPLLFLAGSVTFKVSLMAARAGMPLLPGQMSSFLVWVYGVVIVCMGGAFIMALLTAHEVSRSAAKLVHAMKQVESGDLDVRLQVTSTDEYADLFRGFNLMTEELNEEVKILGISHSLMGELQLNVLLERIIRVSTELLDAERSTLFLYDPKKDELWSRFAEGLGHQEIRIKPTTGIAGAVFTSGHAENISDVSRDPRFNSAIDKRTGYHTRNMLTMPVVNKAGARIGVTQVLNKRGGSFTAKDESRLRAFTAQIAIALENAKLFDDVLRIQNYNEAILRSTSNAMITLDNERRIVTANDASLELLKLGGEALVGVDADTIFVPPNDWVFDSIAKVEDTGDTDLAVDAELRLRSGDIASVNLTSVPLIDAANQRIGSMLIFEDITDEKRVKSTMSRYLSKEVVDQLLESNEAALGGQVQKISVLFSDIRNFTNISEAIGARDTVSMLNDYFTVMIDVVFRHRGILDKYIGDAIMALFGAPFPGEQDANNAVRAANDMIVTLRTLNVSFIADGRKPIDIGVGINTGDAVVGSIGSPKRMEYTAIGDSVNLASRLEGACKAYGAKVIISEYTVRALTVPARLRELDLMRVKGKDQPVAIFEALGHHTAETFPNMDRALDHFSRGLTAYRQQDWSGARAQFESALEAHPADAPSRLYRERCLQFAAHPPGDDWDGVWVMKEK